MNAEKTTNIDTNDGWWWVPSLYFTQGIPYVMVMSISVIMYKKLEISNTAIALYTSWLYLPWVIKPIWSPLVELFLTKRAWFVSMQLLMGASCACIAFTIPADAFFQWTLAFFWLLAFSSATHDIAADGFYMIGLNQSQQAFFVGIRSTFYRLSMITAQGLLVIFAGKMEIYFGNIRLAWALTFVLLSILLISMFVYHQLVVPKGMEVEKKEQTGHFLSELKETFLTFFQKQGIWIGLPFLLLYRLSEAQLVKLASPFLLDKRSDGGMGLSTEAVGTIYGTLGVAALLLGGVIGGVLIARNGLKYWIWPMALSINLPNGLYALLAFFQPESIFWTGVVVIIEQLGYGFGFTAFMMYMIYVADGPYKTAHYALCTGFMAMGMMFPGMWSGWLQEMIGYPWFFTWVLISAIPCLVLILFMKIPADFGKKTEA